MHTHDKSDMTIGSAPTVIAPRLVINPPLVAAKGDDSLMSQAQQALPSPLELKGRWKQLAGEAKIAWSKITEDELLNLEGHAQKLVGLVQERYAIKRDEAEAQVRAFLDKHKS